MLLPTIVNKGNLCCIRKPYCAQSMNIIGYYVSTEGNDKFSEFPLLTSSSTTIHPSGQQPPVKSISRRTFYEKEKKLKSAIS